MKITLLSTFDKSGGAAIACMRVAKALLQYGFIVKVLTMIRSGNESFVSEVAPSRKWLNPWLRHGQYAWEQRFVSRPGYQFSGNPWWGHDISQHPDVLDADIIQLHWVNQGFLGVKELAKLFKLNKPITWHMHDLWPFTGGCHYPGSCRHFEENCGWCPALRESSAFDASYRIFKSKADIFKQNPPTLVGASNWLSLEAAKSTLGKIGRVAHIPNPIFENEYFPGSRMDARQKLGINSDKKGILFAAVNTSDPRKGFFELVQALNYVKTTYPEVDLFVAGKPPTDLKDHLPFPAFFLGSLSAEKMRLAYQAADLFVIPSLEENLPNTILESLACGTPVAGFRTGGIPEMVNHGSNGFLADKGNIQELSVAILNILQHHNPQVLFDGALETIRKSYLPEIISKQYADLFKELITGNATFPAWIST